MAINLSTSQLNSMEVIGDGGEAVVKKYKPGLLIKEFINKDPAYLAQKQKRVQFYATHCNFSPYVVGPLEEVFANNKFVGYVMNAVPNAEAIAVLANINELKFNGITNKDVLETLLIASDALIKGHENKFIFADISDQNILLSNQKPFFIDVDSFGYEGRFSTNVYTPLYTDPNAFLSTGALMQTYDTDKYAFNVLLFHLLTLQHPFGGKYLKDKNMKQLDRMKNGISVLRAGEVKLLPFVPSWKWISPDVLYDFGEVFEKGKRIYLHEGLVDLHSHLKFCKNHNGYYYGKYTECPVCNDTARIILAPVIVKPRAPTGTHLIRLFKADDAIYIIDFGKYFSTNKEIVSMESKKTVPFKKGVRVEFLDQGNTILKITDDMIDVCFKGSDHPEKSYQKAHKSNYQIAGNKLFYIDQRNILTMNDVTPMGNVRRDLISVYTNTIFSATEDGNYCAILLFPHKAVIKQRGGRDLFFDYKGRITEYTIKQDPKSKNWLFVYKTNSGEFRTIIIGSDKILKDTEVWSYDAVPLSNICYFGDQIYDPSDKIITAINWKDNRSLPIEVSVVNEQSKLIMDEKGFKITTEKEIYRYGKA